MSNKCRVVIYGGKGSLGSCCVTHFKSKQWWVASVDFSENEEADLNILVSLTDSLIEQETKVLPCITSALNDEKLDAVLCVAGGWVGGNVARSLIKSADLMLRQNVWSSLIASSIAAEFLKEGGLLTLTGASAATEETPRMIGYGVSKASVHHLTKCLAQSESGLPVNSTCIAILPVTLDTELNRKWMSESDFSDWTPLEFVAELLLKWSMGQERPDNGSLLRLVTKNFITDVIKVE